MSVSLKAAEPDPATGTEDRPLTAPARVVLVTLRTYQATRAGHVTPCRFTPTCSQYAVEAVQHHGVRRGLRLTLGRLGRCRPGGPFGSDPVPD